MSYAKHGSAHADALGGGLLEALQPVLLRDDRRTDHQQPCEAWKGADRRAFEDLHRRYRPRILQLATSMRLNQEDAEEIVQETLLGLFLRRRTLGGDCPPDNLVGGLAAASVLARLLGDRRRTRLLSALAHAAVTDRAEREGRGQPDEGLLATELAARAGAAVRNLPGQGRRVFWLRAVEGQSEEEAGASLDMTPSLVDVWLLYARRLIAHSLLPYFA